MDADTQDLMEAEVVLFTAFSAISKYLLPCRDKAVSDSQF